MNREPHPSCASEISAAWLSEVMGDEVTSFELDEIGAGVGIFGEIVRVSISGATSLPAAVVAKFPTQQDGNRAVGDALGIYEREVRFFNEIAPHSELRVPNCHVADSTDGVHVLLLEDLHHHRAGDQVEGVAPADAERIVDGLARLHVTWWDRPELHELSWLPTSCDPQYLAAVPPIYAAGLPVLVDKWSDRVGDDAVALAQRIGAKFDDVIRRTADAPTTFLHGDSRLDNFFFDEHGEPIFIDFQLSIRGRGPHDLAYLIGSSMNVADQRVHWERLLRRYHERLIEAGIENYDWDRCLHDYRESLLFLTVGAMSLIATFDAGNDRGAAMSEAYTVRMLRHAVESGADLEL
jgi:Phosphotransferase enzyme family